MCLCNSIPLNSITPISRTVNFILPAGLCVPLKSIPTITNCYSCLFVTCSSPCYTTTSIKLFQITTVFKLFLRFDAFLPVSDLSILFRLRFITVYQVLVQFCQRPDNTRQQYSFSQALYGISQNFQYTTVFFNCLSSPPICFT